ncbi:MAG TPA: hypothetical protein GX743_00355 [Actinomycetales bacterium]|nr:hypothetical protein [Actinomycetales bacterium]
MGESIRLAARLLVRNWAIVLAIVIAGAIAHEWGFVAAASVSVRAPYLGFVLSPLPVLAIIASYVLVLLYLKPQLPSFRGEVALGPEAVETVEAGEVRRRANPMVALSRTATAVMLPFFGLYASLGFLTRDFERYQQEWFVRSFSLDREVFSPFQFEFTAWLVVFVVVVYLLRLVAGRLTGRWPVFGPVGVYLEALWTFTLAMAAFQPLKDLLTWVSKRALSVQVAEWWEGVTDSVAPVRSAWSGLSAALGSTIGPAMAVAVTAMAWFAIAALVLGKPLKTVHISTVLAEKSSRFRQVSTWTKVRWDRLPDPVRSRLGTPFGDIRSRGRTLLSAFRAMGGLSALAILGFVVAWAGLEWMQQWTGVAVREMFGVQDTRWWYVFYSPIQRIPTVIFMSLKLLLLAVAYDRAMRARKVSEAAPDQPRGGGSADPALPRPS